MRCCLSLACLLSTGIFTDVESGQPSQSPRKALALSSRVDPPVSCVALLNSVSYVSHILIPLSSSPACVSALTNHLRPEQTLVAYENLKKHFPYPEPNQSLIETVLPRDEEIARVRARNALKGTFYTVPASLCVR